MTTAFQLALLSRAIEFAKADATQVEVGHVGAAAIVLVPQLRNDATRARVQALLRSSRSSTRTPRVFGGAHIARNALDLIRKSLNPSKCQTAILPVLDIPPVALGERHEGLVEELARRFGAGEGS